MPNASVQAFSSTPIGFYQFWWSHHWFCVGQLLLDSLSTHSIHSLPTCTKPTQNPPPGGTGHARAKVSWFGILPHCLYLSLLEKELQVSYMEAPTSLPYGREISFLSTLKNISSDNTLSYLRGILILSVKQCKGVSTVKLHIPKHGIWLTTRKTRAFRTYRTCWGASELTRFLWLKMPGPENSTVDLSQNLPQVKLPFQVSWPKDRSRFTATCSVCLFLQTLHWDVQLTLQPSVQFWNLPSLLKTTVICSLGGLVHFSAPSSSTTSVEGCFRRSRLSALAMGTGNYIYSLQVSPLVFLCS